MLVVELAGCDRFMTYMLVARELFACRCVCLCVFSCVCLCACLCLSVSCVCVYVWVLCLCLFLSVFTCVCARAVRACVRACVYHAQVRLDAIDAGVQHSMMAADRGLRGCAPVRVLLGKESKRESTRQQERARGGRTAR